MLFRQSFIVKHSTVEHDLYLFSQDSMSILIISFESSGSPGRTISEVCCNACMPAEDFPNARFPVLMPEVFAQFLSPVLVDIRRPLQGVIKLKGYLFLRLFSFFTVCLPLEEAYHRQVLKIETFSEILAVGATELNLNSSLIVAIKRFRHT
jgi:hypothetical protein